MSNISFGTLALLSEFIPGSGAAWICTAPRARRSKERSSRGLRLGLNRFEYRQSLVRKDVHAWLRCDIADVQGMILSRWWLQRCSGASQPTPSPNIMLEADPGPGKVRLQPPPQLSRFVGCPLALFCWGNRRASAASRNETASAIDVPTLDCSLGELLSLGYIKSVEVNGAALSPSPPEWQSCLAISRGVEQLSIKAATVPLNELLSVLYSNSSTLRLVEVAGVSLPRLEFFALAPRIEEMSLQNVAVLPHSVMSTKERTEQRMAPSYISHRVPLSDLGALKHLWRLDLTNCKADFDCVGIAQCSHLRSVHLNGCSITDADVLNLGELPLLEELLLARTLVTNVQGLIRCRGLRFLQLSNTQVDSRGIEGLEMLPHLTRLDLSSTLVSDANCLERSPSIICLNLAKTCVTSAGISRLPNLQTMEQLMLNDNNLHDVSFLAQSRSLKTLMLQSTLVDSASVDDFGRLKTLQDLSLAHTRVTNVTQLRHCENLWRLDLQGSLVDQAGIAGLELLSKLRVLLLSQTDVTSLELILQSKSLEHLDLKFSRVTAEKAFQSLTTSSALTELTLTHCDVSNVGALGQCRGLRVLNLWSSHVTTEGLTGLCDAKSLEEVDLAETLVTEIDPLLQCTRIQTLILYKSPLRSLEGIGALQQLSRLDVADTPVRSLRGLAACKNLEILNISNTAVDDAGFEGIGLLSSLKSVLLSFTAITTLGELGSCVHLEELHAQSCPVTSQGLDGLERACGLVKLNLSYTKIRGSIRRFTKCDKLAKLNVKFTEVPYEEVAFIEKHLPRCRVINDAAQRIAKNVTLR